MGDCLYVRLTEAETALAGVGKNTSGPPSTSHTLTEVNERRTLLQRRLQPKFNSVCLYVGLTE